MKTSRAKIRKSAEYGRSLARAEVPPVCVSVRVDRDGATVENGGRHGHLALTRSLFPPGMRESVSRTDLAVLLRELADTVAGMRGGPDLSSAEVVVLLRHRPVLRNARPATGKP